ncbi:MAG: QueT transporter family protein [Christensenellales bacterium]|nr:QueT transporter [uncultured bacterium]
MNYWKKLDQHGKTMFIVRSAVIAALYAALTLALYPISFGAVQFRVSEALTLLPIVMPEAIPGLFVGCLVSNLIGSATPWDIIFGSLATLIAAILTYATRRNKILAAFWPVLCNTVIVGLVLALTLDLPVFLTMGEVGLGELAVVYTVGMAMLAALKRVPKKLLGGQAG